ncbi:hypothetical protein BS17DRAFT_788237 [Gyrodon lividus]|nr:hypothetical protein BS17DRAFT_788237 [Gyrodon lividus]
MMSAPSLASLIKAESLRLLFNQMTVAATAAVCYDYILTFSREIDLIWRKSWSTMSALFIVVSGTEHCFADKGLATGMLLSSSMTYTTVANLYCSTVPYLLYPRLVLSLKSHRSKSDGLFVGSNGPSHLHFHSHSASSGGPGNGDYELSPVNSPTDQRDMAVRSF